MIFDVQDFSMKDFCALVENLGFVEDPSHPCNSAFYSCKSEFYVPRNLFMFFISFLLYKVEY